MLHIIWTRLVKYRSDGYICIKCNIKQCKTRFMKRKYGIKTSILFQFILFSILFACDTVHSPDLIFMNGKIITVDLEFSVVNAIAIEKDKIVGIGSNKKIGKLADDKTRIPGQAHLNFN